MPVINRLAVLIFVIISGCSVLNLDTDCDLVDFNFIASEEIYYRRDNQVAAPISFSMQVPSGRENLFYNNTRFGFFYPDSEIMFLKTRLFNHDSSDFETIELSRLDAEENVFKFFNPVFQEQDIEYADSRALEGRRHFMIKYQGNIFILYNLKNENINCFKSSVRSFKEGVD